MLYSRRSGCRLARIGSDGGRNWLAGAGQQVSRLARGSRRIEAGRAKAGQLGLELGA